MQSNEQSQGGEISDLLNSKGISSLEELHLILFDRQFNQIFSSQHPHQFHRIQLTKQQKDSAIKFQYEDLCTLYDGREELVEEARALLSHKYKHHNIIFANSTHKKVWKILSKTGLDISELKLRYYEDLKHEPYPEYYHKQIENDVKRTVEDKSSEKMNTLSNILRTVAKKNPFVGYCQGMNFIANFLDLLQFEEAECFWIFNYLIEDVLPKNYYTDMQGIAIDLEIIDAYLALHQPELHAKLQEMSVNISLFALEWLICLFTTALPYHHICIVWDLLFLEGSSILLKIVILMLEELKPTFLQAADFTDLLDKVQSTKKVMHIDQETFLQRIDQIYIDSNMLQVSRQIYQLILNNKKHKNQAQQKKGQKMHCNLMWPICHESLRKTKVESMEFDAWVFKQKGGPNFIDNYLEQKNIQKPRHDSAALSKSFVGRVPHICSPHLKSQDPHSIELQKYDPENKVYEVSIESIVDQQFNFFEKAKLMNRRFLG